ncbi:MAG: VWA domain-containing protein [Fibrobacterales bacterium]
MTIKIITLLIMAQVCFGGIENTWNRSRIIDNVAPIADQRIFDVSISLHDSPGQGSDKRAKIIEVLQAWARGIYEVTNGAHYLGKVMIFQDGYAEEYSSVIWGSNQQAYSHIGGWSSNTAKILIGDKTYFKGELIDFELNAVNPTKLGFILTHEWVKYTYGILEQSKGFADNTTYDWEPKLSDDIGINTLTSNPLNAFNASDIVAHLQYLNVDALASGVDNAQYRVFDASSWDVLSTLYPDGTIQDLNIPYFEELQYYKPELGDDLYNSIPYLIVNTESGTDYLDHFSYEWRSNQIVADIIIDKSGSMGDDSKMTNAKLAAERFVNNLNPGDAINFGITSFSTTIDTTDMSITPIVTSDIRQDLVDAINDITIGGWTKLYEGAVVSLEKILMYRDADYDDVPFRYGFLLSDGESAIGWDGDGNLIPETDFDEADVIAEYVAAGVPLFTIGYGAGAPEESLEDMAVETEGLYFSNTEVDDIAKMQLAYESIYNKAVGEKTLLKDLHMGAHGDITFSVDQEAEFLKVVISSFCGASLLNKGVYDNGGELIVDPLVDRIPATGYGADYSILDRFFLEVGEHDGPHWTVKADGCEETYLSVYLVTDLADEDAELSIDETKLTISYPGTSNVNAYSSIAFKSVTTNSVALPTNRSLKQVRYPEPLSISAGIYDNSVLRNMTVTSRVVYPNGDVILVPLNDQGYQGDVEKNDGRYSVKVDEYNQNGIYKVQLFTKNTGAATRLGGSPSEEINNFTRYAELEFEVGGVIADDQVDEDYRIINANNTSNIGKIDFEGDVDVFEIVGTREGEDLMVRVANIPGNLDLVLEVYDGTEMIALFDNSSNCTKNNYALVVIDSEMVRDGLRVKVANAKVNAGMSSYSLSVGAVISTDGYAGGTPSRNLFEEFIAPYPGAITSYQFKSGLWPQVLHLGNEDVLPNITETNDARFAIEYIPNVNRVVQFMMNLNPVKFGTALERLKAENKLTYNFNTEYPEFTIHSSRVANLAGSYYLRIESNTVYWVRKDNAFVIKWTTAAPSVVVEQIGTGGPVSSLGSCVVDRFDGYLKEYTGGTLPKIPYGYFPNKYPVVTAVNEFVKPNLTYGDRFNVHWALQNGTPTLIEFSINISGVPRDNYERTMIHNFDQENPMFTIQYSNIENLDGTYYIKYEGNSIIWIRIDNMVVIEWK